MNKYFRIYRYSYERQLLQERPETTTALTQFVIRNAVHAAERCVADTASSAAGTTAAKRGRKKSDKSPGIVEKFLNQVRRDA